MTTTPDNAATEQRDDARRQLVSAMSTLRSASGAPSVAHRDTEARADRKANHHHDEQEQNVSTDPNCSPDGEHCDRCGGVHNPQPGCTFVTSRTWGPADDDDQDDEQD